MDQTGTLANVKRHDYLPFGEELLAPAGGRTAALGYSTGDGVRQQFTGQERDGEISLDHFGARYYSATQGRFTSSDPMPLKKRHLSDPRDLNRYVYVANNPLKYLDPDGLEKIEVIVRTYIPAEKLTHPPAVGATFKGDYNSKGERVSTRTEQKIIIDTDAKRADSDKITYTATVGKTVRTARGAGSILGPSEGQADGKSLQAGMVRINHNTVRVDVNGDEANPLVTASPGITFRFNITVSSEGKDGKVSIGVLGQHDGFPAYEIEIARPESGGSSTVVYQHDPNKTGDGPQSLYGSGEYYPNLNVVVEPGKKKQ
jgi:RHS repeat-associated protein